MSMMAQQSLPAEISLFLAEADLPYEIQYLELNGIKRYC